MQQPARTRPTEPARGALAFFGGGLLWLTLCGALVFGYVQLVESFFNPYFAPACQRAAQTQEPVDSISPQVAPGWYYDSRGRRHWDDGHPAQCMFASGRQTVLSEQQFAEVAGIYDMQGWVLLGGSMPIVIGTLLAYVFWLHPRQGPARSARCE